MGLGAYPGLATRSSSGMLGMHGTYEANIADARLRPDVCVGARFDDRVTGRLNAFAPESKKIHIDIDPSSINKNVHGRPARSSATAGRVLEALIAAVATHAASGPTPARSPSGGGRSTAGARATRFGFRNSERDHQAAIRDPAAVRADHAGRDVFITTEVGQHQMWAAQHFHFEQPNHWMTSRRPRHHGLWPAGGDGRADRASRRAGDRHRRRGLDPDEHPGDVDRRRSTACR